LHRNQKYLFRSLQSQSLPKRGLLERVPHVPDIVTLTINPAIDIFVNVPRIKPTRKLRCSAPKRDPGGGGINVARVAHVSAATLWRFTRQAAQSENCCTGSWSVRTSIAL
jgi:hypothetical protein